MSKSNASKFSCEAPITNDGDHMVVEWDIGDQVYFACYQNGSSASVALGSNQLVSLRDQINNWLESHP